MADGPSTSAEGACGGTREFVSKPTGEDPVQNVHDDGKRQKIKKGSEDPIVKWQEAVKQKYPKWKTNSYFVPSTHMNRTGQREEKIAGKSVPVAITPGKSATQDDLAQQHSLQCFQYLASHEVMFVLSNLKFSNYLKGMRTYSPKSKFVFRRTIDEKLKKKGLHEGDFDILVIHRRYGVLGCEIKSKGYEYETTNWNEGQKKAIVEKIKNEAVVQLNKYREVLSHILSDLKPACRLRMSLILPYVDRNRLTDLLADNIQEKEELCACLGLPVTSDLTLYCLLSDDMPDKHQPWELTDAVKTSLDAWWRRVMSDHGHDPHMTETRYLNILSRFCGPDTEIPGPRTMGEAIAQMAVQFMKFRLTNNQLKIVKEEQNYLWVDGPPGVGKTVVLIYKALQWLLEKMEVHVISLYDQGLAAAEFICSELRRFDPKKDHLIHLHHTPSEGEASVLKTLETAAKKCEIAVVMDEAYEVMSMLSETDQSCPLSSHYESFICRIVLPKVVSIKRLWAASLHPVGTSIMDNRRLTESLRTPPAITRETAKSPALKMKYPEFKLGDVPPVSDGMGRVKVIEHLLGGKHQGVIPADCYHCGKELAEFLLEDLQVGDDHPRETSQGKVMERSPLRFEHIFILSIKPFPIDLNRPAEEEQCESSSPFLLGLEQGGVPVKVVQRQDRESVQRMARSEVEGAVIASDVYTVRGLERALVVWVQAEKEVSHQQACELDLARLYGMSRSTGHVVCVCTPGVARDAGWPL